MGGAAPADGTRDAHGHQSQGWAGRAQGSLQCARGAHFWRKQLPNISAKRRACRHAPSSVAEQPMALERRDCRTSASRQAPASRQLEARLGCQRWTGRHELDALVGVGCVEVPGSRAPGSAARHGAHPNRMPPQGGRVLDDDRTLCHLGAVCVDDGGHLQAGAAGPASAQHRAQQQTQARWAQLDHTLVVALWSGQMLWYRSSKSCGGGCEQVPPAAQPRRRRVSSDLALVGLVLQLGLVVQRLLLQRDPGPAPGTLKALHRLLTASSDQPSGMPAHLRAQGQEPGAGRML